MRESVFFELRLRRFGVWRVAVWLVAGAAIAAVAAWAVAMFDSQPESGRALVMAVAVGLSLATIGLALSLARVEGGLLTCSDGVWTFVTDTGAAAPGRSRWRWTSAPSCCFDSSSGGERSPGCRSSAVAWSRSGTPCAARYIRRPLSPRARRRPRTSL
jgi:hypothetical protein